MYNQIKFKGLLNEQHNFAFYSVNSMGLID